MRSTEYVTTALMLAGLTVFAGSVHALQDPAAQPASQAIEQSQDKIQQLVAPIALYADSLIAQILSGATYPEQIVDASQWVQTHTDLKGDGLASQVDLQAWDPSVKALAQFPAVLANMSKNLAWTSELGDAYQNQHQDVMQAIQTMRERARKAGNLQSTDQQKVKDQGSTIVIEPASTSVVYVPQYDPWLVYGYPLSPFPGWYSYPGLFLAGPGIGWGLGFDIGFFAGFGWGFPHWGYDWHHGGRIIYQHNVYVSHSRTVVRRNDFRGASRDPGRAGRTQPGRENGADRAASHWGGAKPAARSGTRSSAFSGFNRGFDTRMSGVRGRASFGGGGFHGGGGRR